MAKPLLSIGIIFTNEIRCLERCMKSLQPLRDAIPCELVMADTGSDDGSRQVAEKYADILFDFPWVNDFSAARNAVLDRCSGKWYMSIDCDEWLDEDVSRLVNFLRSPKQWGKLNAVGVTVRNYTRWDLQGDFNDFSTVRIFRMSTGVHYTGIIHEHFDRDVGIVHLLSKTILHHDGYVGLGGTEGLAKRKRNTELLKEQLRKKPDNLQVRLQCLESNVGPEKIKYLQSAMEGVEEKLPDWQIVGSVIYRWAVTLGYYSHLPEFDEWVARAWELFPNSMFTKIDVSYIQFQAYFKEGKYSEAISCGKEYLKALKDYREFKHFSADIMCSSLLMISNFRENILRVDLLDALYKEKRFHEAYELLGIVDFLTLPMEDFQRYIKIILTNIHAHSDKDMGKALLKLWSKIETLEDSEQRKDALIKASSSVFTQQFMDDEREECLRHAYTIFLPLEGKCPLGDAAAIMVVDDPAILTEKLSAINDWKKVPITVLTHALERGASFPSPHRPMKIEELDSLVRRLINEGIPTQPFIPETPLEGKQSLCWARTLATVTVQSCKWDSPEQDMALFRSFAAIEKKFLEMRYTSEMLSEDGVLLLPQAQRFGWYCVRAFSALDNGNYTGCVYLLREILKDSPDMKTMVDFLLTEVERQEAAQRIHNAPPELAALAEKVKTILAGYAPNDPAVAALKQSPVYQRVAWLIESCPAPVGKIAQ